MTFQAPTWLCAIPAVVAVAWWLSRRSAAASARLPGERGGVAGRDRAQLRRRFEWLGALLVATGLALPRVGSDTGTPPRPAVCVVDLSRSMLAEDDEGSRFLRVRQRMAGALATMAGRKIGLVTFAGSAEEVAPPTTDFSALRALLDDFDPRRTLDNGSDAAAGLTKAIDRLKSTGGDVLLFSDGEWEGESSRELAAATAARAAGVAIHVVPSGGATPIELFIRESDGTTTPLTTEDGRRVTTRADRPRMEALAASAHGRVILPPLPSRDVVGTDEQSAFAFLAPDRRDGDASDPGWPPWSLLLAAAFVVLAEAHALRERTA